MALSDDFKEATYPTKLSGELKLKDLNSPVDVRCDNVGAI